MRFYHTQPSEFFNMSMDEFWGLLDELPFLRTWDKGEFNHRAAAEERGREKMDYEAMKADWVY